MVKIVVVIVVCLVVNAMYKTLIFIPLCMSLQHVTHTEDSWRWEHDFKAHISNHRHLYFKALFHFVFPIILDVHCPSIVQMCFSVWRWIDNQYLVATSVSAWGTNFVNTPPQIAWQGDLDNENRIKKIVMKCGNDNIHFNREPCFCQHTPSTNMVVSSKCSCRVSP